MKWLKKTTQYWLCSHRNLTISHLKKKGQFVQIWTQTDNYVSNLKHKLVEFFPSFIFKLLAVYFIDSCNLDLLCLRRILTMVKPMVPQQWHGFHCHMPSFPVPSN